MINKYRDLIWLKIVKWEKQRKDQTKNIRYPPQTHIYTRQQAVV